MNPVASDRIQEAIRAAEQEATKHNNQAIEPEHLLYVLIRDEKNVVREELSKIRINLHNLENALEREMKNFPKTYGAAATQHYISPDLKSVLILAEKKAAALQDEVISANHVLMSMIEQKSPHIDMLLKRNFIANLWCIWGMIFRALFICTIGLLGWIWIDPDMRPKGDIPFAELTLNMLFSPIFAVALVGGCMFWFFCFPEREKHSPIDKNPYTTWANWSLILILAILFLLNLLHVI